MSCAARQRLAFGSAAALLCVSVGIGYLWIRIRDRLDWLVFVISTQHRLEFGSRTGSVQAAWYTGPARADLAKTRRGSYGLATTGDPLSHMDHRFLGFGCKFYRWEGNGRPTQVGREVVAPHGFLVAGPAGCALLAARYGLRADGRRRRGLCVRCGYDLRATPSRCPECGSPVEGRSNPGA